MLSGPMIPLKVTLDLVIDFIGKKQLLFSMGTGISSCTLSKDRAIANVGSIVAAFDVVDRVVISFHSMVVSNFLWCDIESTYCERLYV